VAASSAATSEAESRPAPVGGTAALPDAHPEREREYELEEDL